MSGRLVWNHSTHVDGLITVLRKLCEKGGIKTVTPGRLRPVKGNGCALRLRVSVPVSGGWKVNVRQGRLAQEVFVVTDLTKEALQAEIATLVE